MTDTLMPPRCVCVSVWVGGRVCLGGMAVGLCVGGCAWVVGCRCVIVVC